MSVVSAEPTGMCASEPVPEARRASAAFVYICHLTEAEVRAVARLELPETFVAYCQDAVLALDETQAETVLRMRGER